MRGKVGREKRYTVVPQSSMMNWRAIMLIRNAGIGVRTWNAPGKEAE